MPVKIYAIVTHKQYNNNRWENIKMASINFAKYGNTLHIFSFYTSICVSKDDYSYVYMDDVLCMHSSFWTNQRI